MESARVSHAAWGRDGTLISPALGRERGTHEDPQGSVLREGGSGGIFRWSKGQAVPGAREVKDRREFFEYDKLLKRKEREREEKQSKLPTKAAASAGEREEQC